MNDMLHNFYLQFTDSHEEFLEEDKNYVIICQRIQEIRLQIDQSATPEQKKWLSRLSDWETSRFDMELEGNFKMGMKYGAKLMQELLASSPLTDTQLDEILKKLNLLIVNDL